MNIVQVSVDPDHLVESVNRYEHHHHDSDTDGNLSD
jgi:hypothetical protein